MERPENAAAVLARQQRHDLIYFKTVDLMRKRICVMDVLSVVSVLLVQLEEPTEPHEEHLIDPRPKAMPKELTSLGIM